MQGYVEDFRTLDSRQFVIALRRLADSLAYGIDRSPFVGSGIEYAQSRPYQWGDSVRSMDWRVTARTGRHHVKEYETPKSMPCYLLIDTSASMTVSSVARSKYETALFVAGGLALACLDRVSPVGVVGVGERALRIQPSLSRPRVLQWLLQLRAYRYDEGTSLGARLVELGPSLAQRSLVVVLSDLHDPAALGALKRLVQVHDCVVLQFQDPAETGLRGSGFLRAREAETGREFVTHGRRRWLEPEEAARELKRCGIDHLVIRTDRPFAHSLRNLFKARGWLGKGSR
ncbi:MAG TPA: DUF58 domain-containing protein [Planctomycetota bacterium]|nr:DUF58 domain-containing protein [Planctomycetota bacterium]